MSRRLYLCEILDLVGSDGYVMLCSAKTGAKLTNIIWARDVPKDFHETAVMGICGKRSGEKGSVYIRINIVTKDGR